MLAYQELDALVLEVVIHHALVVAGDTHAPLLELADDALAALLGHTGDVALCACILEAKVVTIADENVSNGVKNWARGRPCENSVGIAVQGEVITLGKALKITF